jgi:hypothetical protein
MNNQEITHKDEGGKESFKFTQRGYMWLNPETLKWSYCNPAFSLRSLADIERIVELEEEKLHMQISMTCVRELISVISAFVENIEPRSSEAVTVYNQCMEICSAIDDMDLPEFEFEALKEPKL